MTNNAYPAGEKILEGNNKLIAKFMNLHSFQDSRYGLLWADPLGSNTSQFSLKYHESWGWLMPVLEKIVKMPLQKGSVMAQTNKMEKVISALMIMDKERIYLACIDFITWYNQQTPSNGK